METDEKELKAIVSMLPIGIKLTKLWDYEYVGTIRAKIDVEKEITLYVFKWNGENKEHYTLEVVQEMFDIKNLYRRILGKGFKHLSDQEKIFMYKYSRMKEGIDVYDS